MRLMWDEDAWEEYLYWQTQDKKTLKRVNLLLKDIKKQQENDAFAAKFGLGRAFGLDDD